jgi:hypothetical protein
MLRNIGEEHFMSTASQPVSVPYCDVYMNVSYQRTNFKLHISMTGAYLIILYQ